MQLRSELIQTLRRREGPYCLVRSGVKTTRWVTTAAAITMLCSPAVNHLRRAERPRPAPRPAPASTTTPASMYFWDGLPAPGPTLPGFPRRRPMNWGTWRRKEKGKGKGKGGRLNTAWAARGRERMQGVVAGRPWMRNAGVCAWGRHSKRGGRSHPRRRPHYMDRTWPHISPAISPHRCP